MVEIFWCWSRSENLCYSSQIVVSAVIIAWKLHIYCMIHLGSLQLCLSFPDECTRILLTNIFHSWKAQRVRNKRKLMAARMEKKRMSEKKFCHHPKKWNEWDEKDLGKEGRGMSWCLMEKYIQIEIFNFKQNNS